MQTINVILLTQLNHVQLRSQRKPHNHSTFQ